VRWLGNGGVCVRGQELCSTSQLASRDRRTHTIEGRYFGLEGNVEISTSTSTSTSTKLEAHPRGTWWVAKTGLILVAIFLFTLTVAALEWRMGITPSDDSATAWVLGGE
jgi:hypothetical protein